MKLEILNEMLKDFLIKKREQAGLSQSDVAARSEVFGMGKILDQRTVSRIEQHPIAADAIKIAGYLTAVGVPPQQYYELLNELTYKEDGEIMAISKENKISEQISSALEKVSRAKNIVPTHEYLQSLNLTDSFDQINSLLKNMNRKPVIGFFGHFDAGKSTLINTVINQSVLPTKYQPATCVVNLLMHIDDRPSTILGAVALFRKGFKPYMIHDEGLVKEHLIEEGDATILDRLGVHNYDQSIPNDAYLAIVFLNADILRHVWLLDTPGDLNSSDDSDDTNKALGGVELADSIVFVSNLTGFLKDSDLGFAANIIRGKPPIKGSETTNHLLFIQSHCHSEISHEDIRSASQTAFKRVKKQLDTMIFNTWIEDGHIQIAPSPEQLTSRTQPFWRENDTLRTQTLSKIQEMAEYLVFHQEKMVESNIERTIDQLSKTLSSAVKTLQSRKQSASERIKEVENLDARFRAESEKLINEFKGLIASCRMRKSTDIDSMRDFFRVKTSAEGLTELIEETYTDKKEAQSEIGNYISQLLAAKLESLLKTSGKVVSHEVDDLLVKWQRAASFKQKSEINADVGNLDFDVSAFNSRAAFIGGLTGLGSLGAMSLYVSTIASNLGAYILVGKAAGVLVSLGLVGSVTTVTSFVAAIGGPITIGIALAAAIGFVMYRLVGGSWQKSLAKKVAEAIRKENVWGKVEKPIADFWDNTGKAMTAGLKELILQTDDYLESLKQDALKEYDVEQLENCITAVERAIDSSSEK